MCLTIRLRGQCILHLVSIHRIRVYFSEGQFYIMWCRGTAVVELSSVDGRSSETGRCVCVALFDTGMIVTWVFPD